jgi:hypothetical protein
VKAGGAALVLTLVLCAGLIAQVGLSPAAANAAVAPPPDLAALEQQMAQLHVNTSSISFQEEFSFGGLGGSGIPFSLIIAGKGELSDSPPEGQAVAGIFGLAAAQTRVIGNTVYTYERAAARIDGGRPWVRKQAKGQATGVDPANMLGSDKPGLQGTFSGLIEQLDDALAIVESGPVTVESQRAIEFDATLDPKPFLEKLEAAKPKRPKRPFGSLLEGPEASRRPAKPPKPLALGLEVFIAPNGLPVRERYTFSDEGITVAVRVDTLAVNIPVSVTPPPASQTIDEAALQRIERRRAEQFRRQLRRVCRKQHGRQRTNCLRTVSGIGSSSASESGESGGGSALL